MAMGYLLAVAFHATGASRGQITRFTTKKTNVKIVECHDFVWKHHGKCIQISTNMPGLGLVICGIK